MSGDPHEIAALAARLEAMGALIGLPIDPAYRDGVARALAELLEAADFLAELVLDAETEPSPIFRP
jgi:hypothetical protein